MKKNLKNILFFTLIISFLLSCKSSYILAAIENEIKLKKATAQGPIRSIVKVGGKLYASNGEISVKNAFSESGWSKISKPVKGLATGLATDGTKLYVSFVDTYSDSGLGLWVYDGSWSKIPGTDSIVHVAGSDAVFAASTDEVYPFDGTSLGTKIAGNLLAAGGNYVSNDADVFDNTGVALAGSPAGVKAIVSDGTTTYFLTGSALYNSADLTKSFSHGISSPNMAVLIELQGKKHLLVASNGGGYAEILLDETDITKSKTLRPGDDFSTTPSAAKKQYESSIGKYPAFAIFAESDGTKYYVYLGVNDPNYAKYTGLWGFYSNRGEWNLE